MMSLHTLENQVMPYLLSMIISVMIISVIWNPNGPAAHDFLKVSLIEAFITTHNFDIICFSETFLDCTVSQHDENIMINWYLLLRADHTSNGKRGGVCLYFKEHLPLIRRNDLSILRECLVTEIIVDKEKCFFNMPL